MEILYRLKFKSYAEQLSLRCRKENKKVMYDFSTIILSQVAQERQLGLRRCVNQCLAVVIVARIIQWIRTLLGVCLKWEQICFF